MYGLGAKIVDIHSAAQAAAGVGAIDVLSDLDEGDLSLCQGRRSGADCAGTWLVSDCVCLNLSETDTMLELKQLLSDVSGEPTTKSSVWTAEDERVLLKWADDTSGIHWFSEKKPWMSGIVGVSDLIQRTSSVIAYPTGDGILTMLDDANCIIETAEGLALTEACSRYPIISSTVAKVLDLPSGMTRLDELGVYPYRYGVPASTPPEVLPGGETPTAADPDIVLPAGVLGPAWWGFLGAAFVIGAYGIARWRRHV